MNIVWTPRQSRRKLAGFEGLFDRTIDFIVEIIEVWLGLGLGL